MKYFAVLSLCLSPSLFANTLVNTNLMSCDPMSGLQKNCHISQGLPLIEQQAVESDFFVSYSMSCDRKYAGPVPSKIAVKLSGGPAVTLNYKDSQANVLVGTGFGPLVLEDAFPNELAFRSFGSCELVFTGLTTKPSQKVKAVWQTELDGDKSLLATKLDLIKSLEAIVVLQPAYQFFQELAESLQTELNQNQEVLDAVSKMAACKEADDCDILYRLSSDMDVNLSLDERLLIIQVRTLVSGLTPTSAPLKLSDRLSAKSIEILKKLAADATFYSNAEAQITSETRDAENLRSRIATLEALLAG